MTVLALALGLAVGQAKGSAETVSSRYLLELAGVPVGTVVLSVEGSRYRYVSTHGYRRTQVAQTDDFSLRGDAGVPESYWLWRQPPVGCVDAVAELSRAKGQVCVTDVGDSEAFGTSFGKPFTARYDGQGELLELTVGASRFTRTARPLKAGQPYAQGFVVSGEGALLSLEPPVDGARALSRAPKAVASGQAIDPDACLPTAQRYVERNPGHQLVLGLLELDGRAYPHAWVRGPRGDVDPSASTADAVSGSAAYLELPAAQVGRLYVELLEGSRRVVRR